MNTGIYRIINILNNKSYIGSAVDIKKRFYGHENALGRNIHKNSHLQNAWNIYGKNAFKFEVLLFCDKKNLLFYEQKAIDVNQVTDRTNGYNVCSIAGNHLGVKRSKETKARLSAAKRNMSDETKRRISVAMTGKHPSEETRRKLSEAKKGNTNTKGHVHSKKTKKKMSETHKRKYLSDETLRKMSESSKGKFHSDGSKEKMSEAKKGHIVSKKTRKKLSDANKGKKLSEETKRKISETLRGNSYEEQEENNTDYRK